MLIRRLISRELRRCMFRIPLAATWFVTFFLYGFIVEMAHASEQSNAKSAISVRTAVTWMTSHRPEINFLLKNSGDKPIEFTISPYQSGAKFDSTFPSCSGRRYPPEVIQSDQWPLNPTRETEPVTAGIVPAHGWAHRTIDVAVGIFAPPCHVKYWVMQNSSKNELLWSGVVDIPTKEQAQPVITDDNANLSFSAMVEKDMMPNHVLIRTLIENQGHATERIWVAARELSCTADGRVDWSTEFPVPQGADIGPALIPEHGWVVLVSAVRLIRGGFANCVARIDLSRYQHNEWKPTKTLTIQLIATGKMTRIGVD